MLTYAIATLFVLTATAAIAVIGHSLRRAAPQVAALRADLGLCSDRGTFSYRIAEIVTGIDDGKVVRLPVNARLVAPQGLRAAA